MAHRNESDSIGTIQVPSDKLWGAQTQRSCQYFKISGSLVGKLAFIEKAVFGKLIWDLLIMFFLQLTNHS